MEIRAGTNTKTVIEKIELLDAFEYRLVALGYLQLSFDLEEYRDLHPDNRWQAIYQHLQDQFLPSQIENVFLSEAADWDQLALAVAAN